MVTQKLGYCGLNCEECPVFISTRNNDNELRQRTAEEWSKLYSNQLGNRELSVNDMRCNGCKSENGILFEGCRICPIRKCSKDKNFETCADCNDYEKCEMINGFFTVHQQAKKNLDNIRAH